MKRIELARQLLLDPFHNISEAARRCGFSDPSYFSRVFRKLVGCSPRDYCANPHSYHAPAGEPERLCDDGQVLTCTQTEDQAPELSKQSALSNCA
jgi:hypothetical protein